MARSKKRTPEVENVRPYLEGVAKNVADRVYGPEGLPWGTKLTELEDLCLELREVFTERFLALALERQAEAHAQQTEPTFRGCPSCQRPLDWDKEESRERLMPTRAGEAQWAEPESYCRRCRRAFFPSVP